MGLLDSITGQVLGAVSGSSDGQPSGLVEAIGGLLNNPQSGGFSGLISAFEQQGLGNLISSWISTGKNLPISAEQVQQVLGSDQVQALAQKLGFSTQDVTSHLAQWMPQVVDQLTPNGQVPQTDALGGLLGMLSGLQNNR